MKFLVIGMIGSVGLVAGSFWIVWKEMGQDIQGVLDEL